MEPMVSMKRRSEFKTSIAKPITVSDSRFGIRKFFVEKNPNTRAKKGVYATPGRGANGESSS